MKKQLSVENANRLLITLEERFEQNKVRHKSVAWSKVQMRLKKNPEKLWSLNEMERTGGEPDVIEFDEKKGEYIFYDCSLQSPEGRRSLCYDQEALDSRKENKPKGSAVRLANEMGIEILDEDQYRGFQKIMKFDTKSSSWIKTIPSIRKLGGAQFGDRRFDHVFIYCNGAESYYAGRGFRGCLKV